MRVKTAESPAFSALRWLAGVCALLLVLVSAAGAAPANESVAVVTGPGAPELDRFAEGELCAYLEKLFGLHFRPATSIPAAARHVFLVGNPTTNPLVEKNSFPPVSDQGIVLKPKLGVAEQREWARQYERAWTALDAKHAISKVRSLDSVLAAAQKRKD